MRPAQLNPASSRVLHTDEATPHAVSPASEECRTTSKPPLGRAPSRPAAINLPGSLQRHRRPQRPGLSPLSLREHYGDDTQGHDGDSSVLPRPTAAEMLRRIPQMDRHGSNLGELFQFVEHLTLVPSHDGTTLDCDPTMAPPSCTAEALRLFDLNSIYPVPLDTLGMLVEGFGFGRPNERSQAAPAAPSENSDTLRLLRAIREKDPLLGERLTALMETVKETPPPPMTAAPDNPDIATMLRLIRERNPQLGAKLAALCEPETASATTTQPTGRRSSGG
nr:type III secretion system effector XopY [Xanthomonas vasicola]